jgi:hypothetical protein
LALHKAFSELKAGDGYAVTTDLPVKLQHLRNKLLKERSEMGDEKKNHKVVQFREPPFLKLVKK